jgi:hypothetical protein
MTPLTDDEKRQIATRFQELKTAVDSNEPNVHGRVSAFENVYRGDSGAFIKAFDQATDKTQWMRQLEMYLMDEIEPEFWPLPPTSASDMDDQQDAGRAWIETRVQQIAKANGVKVDEIEFANDSRALGQIVIVRASGGRATADVSFAMLEDLATDAGEQAQVDTLLRDLLARSAAASNK